MAENNGDKRSKLKIVVVIVTVLLAGGLVFFFWTEHQREKEIQNAYGEMEKELRPMEQEVYQLKRKLDELKSDHINDTQGVGSIVLLFTNLDEEIYTEIYPRMKNYGFIGVLALSEKRFPGKEGCLNQEQFQKLMDEGWECCLKWDESSNPGQWRKSMNELVESIGIAIPETVYFPPETYNRDLDSFLAMEGFSVVVHHGEDGLPLITTDFEEKLWHSGAIMWNQNKSSVILQEVISEKGNLVFTVGGNSEEEQYEKERYQGMLGQMHTYSEEDTLLVTDTLGAKEYRGELEDMKENPDFQKQKAELEEQIEEWNSKMELITDKYRKE